MRRKVHSEALKRNLSPPDTVISGPISTRLPERVQKIVLLSLIRECIEGQDEIEEVVRVLADPKALRLIDLSTLVAALQISLSRSAERLTGSGGVSANIQAYRTCVIDTMLYLA